MCDNLSFSCRCDFLVTKGNSYDFFKVRHLIDKKCNPVFLGDGECDDIAGDVNDDEDDYDRILKEQDDQAVVEPAAV